MRLFSYIVTSDSGFAPNPFFGYCTLACCKPVIRRVARRGDWIVGVMPKSDQHKIVYAMKIAEAIPFRTYWNDSRFERKKPDSRSSDPKRRCGDNIYEPVGDGYHQHAGRHGPEQQRVDLNGAHVLVARHFSYFGSNAIKLPRKFSGIIPARGHRSKFRRDLVQKFIAFIESEGKGRHMHGYPAKWPPTLACKAVISKNCSQDTKPDCN